MEDGKITALFFERSEEAVAALSDKYGAVLAKVAYNVLGDRRDAEECVNDAYLAVWNTVPPERPDPLSSYICRIVRNLALKRYRDNTAKKRNGAFDATLDEIVECFPSGTSVYEEAEAKETARIIDRFLGSLDAKSRVMFVRRYWRADGIDEIAKAFHTSRHNVSVRLSRTRKALKEYLSEEGVSV